MDYDHTIIRRLERLTRKLTIPEKQNDQELSYLLLLNLGRAHLYGTQIPNNTPTLAKPALLATLVFAFQLIEDFKKHIASFESQFLESEADECLSLTASLIHQRMDLWAYFIAIETYVDRNAADSDELSKPIDDFADAILQVDTLLQTEPMMGLMSVACETFLLENERRSLSPEFSECLPWWLDGRLEEICDRPAHEGEMYWQLANGEEKVSVENSSVVSKALRKWATNPTLAISASTDSTEILRSLVGQTFTVNGDATTRVMLHPSKDETGLVQVKVVLLLPSPEYQLYTEVEIETTNGISRVELEGGVQGTFSILAADLANESWSLAVWLIDRNQQRRLVRLS